VRRALPFVVLILLAACSKETTTETPAAATDATSPPAADGTAPPGVDGDALPASAFVKPVPEKLPDVVARINGESVSRSEFEDAVRAIESQNGPVPATERDRIYRAVLDRLIGARLLLQESKARKVAVTKEELDERMTMIRQQFPTEQAFKDALSAQKVSLQKVEADQRQQLMVSKMLQAELGAKVAVNDAEIARTYKENAAAFQVPERVKASHILITVSPTATSDEKAEALARAASVLKSARAGKDFAALAKEFSQDPGSAAQGGDLGFFAAAQMVPPFSEAAFKLKNGAISDIVETQFGYHIIKVTGREPARTVPLAEAKPQIEQQLFAQNRDREMQAFVGALRQRGKIEVFI
jgi:peptidyl-prolyl cis-trans isomerase C